VTVAVLAYNRREPLAETLSALTGELDYPEERLEICVVDNASTDGTAEMVRRDFPQVELVELPENVGVAGFNEGLQRGTGDWILMLDDDCYVTGDALKRALTRAREEEADLVSFYVLSETRDPETSFTAILRPGLLYFWGCSVLVSRRAVQRVGGYDPNIFIWGNEIEFTMRVLDAGFRHLYLPEVRSLHNKRVGTKFNLRGHQHNIRHWSYTAAKHLRPWHAATAVFNLALRIPLEGFQHPLHLRVLPSEVLAGVRDGLRCREPLRPEVSRLYRRNFVEWSLPLRWVRGPVARWRSRKHHDYIRKDLERRRERYHARRARYYPEGPGSLQI
jgi:hypothetical protein